MADAPTASMNLTSAGNYILGGVYVGPYTATINGVSTPVICDDFYDDSYVPEWWTAFVYSTNPANYSSTRDAANAGLTSPSSAATLTADYNEVGWLAVQLLNAANAPTPNANTIGEIDFALWSVFDPSAMGSLAGTPAIQSAAQSYLLQAQSYAGNSSYISQFTLYSPDTSQPITCTAGGSPCPDSPPQEFLVRTPEPSEMALLAVDFSGVGLLCLLLVRRKRALRV